jgi:hypothetical protein
MMDDPLSRSLLQIAQARSDALVQKDSDAMNRILADEFVYINSSGEVLTKSEYIQQYVISPDAQWHSQTMEDVHIQVYDGVGVLRCRVHDVAEFAGDPFVASFRSLFVYRRDGDAWRCVAGQTTAIK